MLIHKKAVSVILLILGLSFSVPSYANAENSSDDEKNVIMDALNSGVDAFRSYTTIYGFFQENMLFYPLSGALEAFIAGKLFHLADKNLNKGLEKNLRSSNSIVVNQIIHDNKIVTLEPMSIMEDGKMKTIQKVIKTQEISKAQLAEYKKAEQSSVKLVKRLNKAGMVIIVHSLFIIVDSAYLLTTSIYNKVTTD